MGLSNSNTGNNMHILSFDIEDWFLMNDSKRIPHSQWESYESRIEMNTKIILDVLERNNVKATFFILGWVAEKHPDLIKEIARHGHEIGYHSYYHLHIYHQNKKEFEYDLQKGIQIIESITNAKIKCYRAPYFSLQDHSLWAIPVLMKNGIKVSSSTKAYCAINQQY
ncbi:MAG: polysaccharide deacetylase family protein, partial [Bacteroidota bacterium]|nr:polysaccharide deacetylase family protein [Bacteroidota bacterium]